MPFVITLAVFFLLSLAITAWSLHQRKHGDIWYRDRRFGYMHLVIWNVIGVILAFILTAVFIDQTAYDNRTGVEVPIASMGDTTESHGQWFLGSGYLETGPAYMYYTGDGTNGFRSHLISADQSDIVYTEDEPHLTAWCKDWTKAADWAYIPGWRWGNRPDSIDDPGCTNDRDGINVWVTFYVPSGSVQQTYNLDSQ